MLSRNTWNCVAVGARNLDAHQDAAVVGALVAIVEEADVPARVHARQEAHQRARALRKDEAEEPLVGGEIAAPAHQMAKVLLGHLVVGQVEGRESGCREGIGEQCAIRTRWRMATPTKTCACRASEIR